MAKMPDPPNVPPVGPFCLAGARRGWRAMAASSFVVVEPTRRPGGGRHRQRWKTKMLGAGIAVADADFPDGRRCRTHRRQLERGSERTDDASRREPGHGGTLRGANYFSRGRRRPAGGGGVGSSDRPSQNIVALICIEKK